MERVLGATGEAREEESWSVVIIKAFFTDIFTDMQTPFAVRLFLHLLKMSLIASSPSDWRLSLMQSLSAQHRISSIWWKFGTKYILGPAPLHRASKNVPKAQLLRGRD